jgi:four helix bundle protein
LESYKITKQFPSDEKFAMVQQIRRAALSVYLNIAENSSGKSEVERKKCFEIAGSSFIEMGTSLGIAINYCM